MANTLEYVLSLRDEMSGKLAAIGINSTQALNKFAALERQQKEVKSTMNVFGGSIGALREKLALLRNEREWIPASEHRSIQKYTQEINKLENEIQKMEGAGQKASKGIGVFGIAMGNMLSNVGTKLASMAIGGLENIFNYAAKREQDIVGLSTFVGDNAQKVYKDIQQDAAISPFDTTSLLEVNRALISAGVGAEKARMDAMNLANAISAVGGGNDVLSRMAANMQQIKTVGQATAMDIKQFGMAGINIYQMLANATGKSIEQVKDMPVSYELLTKAFAQSAAEGGMYYGALEKQGQTMQGRLSALKDNVQSAMADVGSALSPVFNTALGVLSQLAGKLPNIVSAFQPLFDQLAQLPIGDIISFIMQIAEPILKIVVPAVHIWIGLFNQVWAALQPGLEALIPLLNVIAEAFQPILLIIGRLIGIIIKHLVPVFNAVIRMAVAVLIPVIQVIGKVLEWVGNLIAPLFDAFMKLFDGVSWVYNKIADFFKFIGNKLGLSSMNAGKKTGDSFIDGFNESMDAMNIAGIKVPGTNTIAPQTQPGVVNTRFGAAAAGGGDDKKKSNEAVATGGQKNVTVNMSIAHMFENFKIAAADFKESVQAAHQRVVEEMVRATAIGASLGGA